MYVIKENYLDELQKYGFTTTIQGTYFWKPKDNPKFELIVNPLGVECLKNELTLYYIEEGYIPTDVGWFDYPIWEITETSKEIIDKILELKNNGLLEKVENI